jgi:hypothetical protein
MKGVREGELLLIKGVIVMSVSLSNASVQRRRVSADRCNRLLAVLMPNKAEQHYVLFHQLVS